MIDPAGVRVIAGRVEIDERDLHLVERPVAAIAGLQILGLGRQVPENRVDVRSGKTTRSPMRLGMSRNRAAAEARGITTAASHVGSSPC